MLGATSQETSKVTPEIRKQFRAALEKFVSAYDETRPLPVYGGQDGLDQSLSSDVTFAGAMRSLGNLHLANGHPIDRYRSAVLSEAAAATLAGLPRSGDLSYVFGTLDVAPWKMEARDRAVSEAAMDY